MKDNHIASEFFRSLSGNLLQPWSSLFSDCTSSMQAHNSQKNIFVFPLNVSLSLNMLTDENNSNSASVAINKHSRAI